MGLDVTPVNRNLHTKVTFMSLEFEDLFVVLGLAAVMNVVSRFFNGSMSAYLQYGVPLAVVPFLMIFKYGKPRGYLGDWWRYQTKPHVYCGIEKDSQFNLPYLSDGE